MLFFPDDIFSYDNNKFSALRKKFSTPSRKELPYPCAYHEVTNVIPINHPPKARYEPAVSFDRKCQWFGVDPCTSLYLNGWYRMWLSTATNNLTASLQKARARTSLNNRAVFKSGGKTLMQMQKIAPKNHAKMEPNVQELKGMRKLSVA